MKLAVLLGVFLLQLAFPSLARAECLQVRDEPSLAISSVNLSALAEMGIDRRRLFEILRYTSELETGGCWANPSDDFDGQMMSVGILQWNYGQDSLQPLVSRFSVQIGSPQNLANFIADNMPSYGAAIFSPACRSTRSSHDQFRAQCFNQLSGPDNHPLPQARAEMEALFNNDLMRQIQLDFFLTELTSVRSRIQELSEGETFNARKTAWAFDMVVQQGRLPRRDNVERVRASYLRRTDDDKKAALLNIVDWYSASCRAIDQDGCWRDYAHNVEVWSRLIDEGISDEQADLILLTYLRSRSATGEEGRWQALSFQRRAAIVFGQGQLARRQMNFNFD